MDLIEAMRTFRRVVERDSFSKAAEDLHQSAAAVSKQVRQLETHLGCVLLQRTTRRMRLTEAGHAYFGECCRLLDDLDALEHAVGSGRDEIGGRLRVNAPLSFGLKVLSPLLPRFTAQYPQVKLDLTLDDRVLDVVSEGFDVSLRIRAALPDSTLVVRKLGEVEQWFCAAPSYLAARGTPADADDLRTHDCLTYGLADGTGWRVDGPDGPLHIAVQPRFTANNSLLLADMLTAGAGIGALPSFVARPLFDAGLLARVLPQYAFAPRGIHAVLGTRRHVPRKVAAFVDFIAAELARAEAPAYTARSNKNKGTE